MRGIYSDNAGQAQVPGIEFVQYSDEKRIGEMIKMIEKDLSEPYSIFTYFEVDISFLLCTVHAVCSSVLPDMTLA